MRKHLKAIIGLIICVLLFFVGIIFFASSGRKPVVLMEASTSEVNNVFSLKSESDIKNLSEGNIDADMQEAEFYLHLLNVRVFELINLFCKIAGKTINYNFEEIQDIRINIISDVPVSLDGVIHAIQQSLLVNGFRISESKEDFISITKVGDSIGALGSLDNDDAWVVTRVVPFDLTIAQAQDLLSPPLVSPMAIIKFIDKSTSISSEHSSSKDKLENSKNFMIITDVKNNVDRVVSLLSAITQNSIFTFKIYIPKVLDIKTLYRAISANSLTVSSARKCGIFVNIKENKIVLIGSYEDVFLYEEILSRIDNEELKEIYKSLSPMLFTRKILHNNFEDISKALNQRAEEIKDLDPELSRALKSSIGLRGGSLVAFSAVEENHVAYINSLIDAMEDKAQIYIDMLIVSLDEAKFSTLGIDWSVNSDATKAENNGKGNFFGQVISNVANAPSMGAASDAMGLGVGMIGRLLSVKGNPIAVMSAVANLMAKDSTSKILAQPYLGGVEGEKAEIFVGKTIPVTIGKQSIGNNPTSSTSNVTSSEQVETLDVGTKISFVAHVDDGDFVKIALEQEITQDTTASTTVSNTSTTSYPYPSLTKMRYSSTLLIPNGSIVVIGGLTLEGSVSESEGAPCSNALCGAIRSVIRMTTGYKSEKKYNQNLLIFLKPKIVRSEEDIYKASRDKYNRMFAKLRDGGSKVIENEEFWSYVDNISK